MQTSILLRTFVLVAVVVLDAPQAVDAICCSRTNQGLCGDCTVATPYCGKGPCNIFACNCDGGCRHGACTIRAKRSVAEEGVQQFTTAEELVSAGDMNGDGVLSFEEAESLLEQRHGPSEVHRRSVRSLDRNMDGQLSADEIDH